MTISFLPCIDYLIQKTALISPPSPPPIEEHPRVKELLELLAKTEAEKRVAYQDRNMTLSLVARMASALGLPVGLLCDVDGEEEFKICLFLDLPAGQVSWHLLDAALSFFDDTDPYEGKWDGHSQRQKWDRVLHPQLQCRSSVTSSSTTKKRKKAVKEKNTL